jgi:signal transduction histidine kinase
MGSNGLTSARHDVFDKYLAHKYPESFDAAVPEELIYSGKVKLTDKVENSPLDAGKLVLSPTRTYAPIIKEILNQFSNKDIHGMVHCSGGAQTKILHFVDQLKVVKNNMFPVPPLVGEINRLMHALADTLDREKQFTNEAAHELRTPLAVLRIHSENAMTAEDDQSREQALRKMLLALDRSDRLIRQLLTQARIDNQQSPALTALPLFPLLQGTLATLAPIALKKDQQLSLEGAEQVQVMGQAMLLELMFGNLIDNALRYTQVGGEVAVVVSQVGNRIRVDVRDNGPGIPTAALSRLCERFFRVNPQQGDGVGLGMAIVSRIAQLHGADLDIHNRPEGGLEVSVLLPASRQA